jgi:hypothetical protein
MMSAVGPLATQGYVRTIGHGGHWYRRPTPRSRGFYGYEKVDREVAGLTGTTVPCSIVDHHWSLSKEFANEP